MTADSPKVQDALVQLNGLRFHYREWGDPAAQPLVLLHGATGHARSWDTFAAAIQDRYRVLALDQRGHGESAWAPAYGPERLVEDTDAFVRALGLRRFALLGLSMGGRNAFTYAALHPEEVERLVIVDIGPEVSSSGAARIQAGIQGTDVFDHAEDAVRSARVANPRAPEAALRHRILNNLIRLEDGRWTWRYDKALRSGPPRQRPDAAAGWALLERISCPTLLVRGAESDLLDREIAERMVQTIPTCRLVEVPESGHSVPLDNPAGFLAAVEDFLRA